MILGFTGTRHGMTLKQRSTVARLFRSLPLTELHHGDAKGSDAQAHWLAVHMPDVLIVIHPPNNTRERAFCDIAPPHSIRKPRPYLVRDQDIVKEGVDGLVAAPKSADPPASLRGQGTWTTVGYARKAKRRVWLVFPDGTYKEEL